MSDQFPVDPGAETDEASAPRFRMLKATLAFCAIGVLVAVFPVLVQGLFELF